MEEAASIQRYWIKRRILEVSQLGRSSVEPPGQQNRYSVRQQRAGQRTEPLGSRRDGLPEWVSKRQGQVFKVSSL